MGSQNCENRRKYFLKNHSAEVVSRLNQSQNRFTALLLYAHFSSVVMDFCPLIPSFGYKQIKKKIFTDGCYLSQHSAISESTSPNPRAVSWSRTNSCLLIF